MYSFFLIEYGTVIDSVVDPLLFGMEPNPRNRIKVLLFTFRKGTFTAVLKDKKS
jgi:hypothetical protein